MRGKDRTAAEGVRLEEPRPEANAAARKRAAVELISRDGASLKQTARRYSLCAEDAEDAYQRALEILLTKAPSIHPQELARWTHTVIKHEALAVRKKRERLLGAVPRQRDPDASGEDWTTLIPASGDGLDERLERRERVARSREALRSLKPAELRALTLLAEGYSYAEIGEITGFSRTKVNRCLAEGRERFRAIVSRSEDGSRCHELRSLLSAFCDGEASDSETATVREHLRACASCRATMRSYRATAAAAAALAPPLPASPSMFERLQELFSSIHSRLPGGAADPAVTQVATAGGAGSTGMAGLAKVLTACAVTAGGATACVATGAAPAPLNPLDREAKAPTVKPVAPEVIEAPVPDLTETEAPSPETTPQRPSPQSQEAEPSPPATEAPAAAPVESGAVEYTAPPPGEAPAPPSEPSGPADGSPAGEFGP